MIYMRNIKGFTLVELMVALAISLVAILAATELYVGTRQTYRSQAMQSRLSEDGRFAQSMLQRIILQAGFRPSPADAISPGYITPVDATSFTVKFVSDGANVVNCDGGVVADATASKAVTSLTISGSGGVLSCGTTNWITSSGNGSVLKDFTVEYGVDTGPNTPKNYGCGSDIDTSTSQRDCVADEYDLVKAKANPGTIVALRLCFVLSTEDVDASVVKTANYPDCAVSAGGIANSKDDHKLYRTFRSTVLLRNR